MAVFSTHESVGPKGLFPTLLVFGAIPRLSRPSPTMSQIERERERDNAGSRAGAGKEAHRVRLGAFGRTQGKSKLGRVAGIEAGSPIIVYGHVRQNREGPYTFVSIEEGTVVIQTERGRNIFRSNCVKNWIRPRWDQEDNANASPKELNDERPTTREEEDGRTEPRTYDGTDKDDQTEGKSTKKEEDRLIEFAESRRK